MLAVDTWLGGPDHQGPTGACNEKLPTLYETFLVNCWDHQDRLIPLRMPTLVGLEFIHFRGYEPDFIYVDADHSYEAVKADLHKAISLFPGATIMGDDWNWGGESLPVQTAVRETAETHGFTVDVRGNWAWTFR